MLLFHMHFSQPTYVHREPNSTQLAQTRSLSLFSPLNHSFHNQSILLLRCLQYVFNSSQGFAESGEEINIYAHILIFVKIESHNIALKLFSLQKYIAYISP